MTIERAITYLDGRGLLLRHPSNHAWVAIKAASAALARLNGDDYD